jgi:hypothetical protein
MMIDVRVDCSVLLLVIGCLVFIFFLYTFHCVLGTSFQSSLNDWSLEIISFIFWDLLWWWPELLVDYYVLFTLLDVQILIWWTFSLETVMHTLTNGLVTSGTRSPDYLTSKVTWSIWHLLVINAFRSKVLLNNYMAHSWCCGPSTSY